MHTEQKSDQNSTVHLFLLGWLSFYASKRMFIVKVSIVQCQLHIHHLWLVFHCVVLAQQYFTAKNYAYCTVHCTIALKVFLGNINQNNRVRILVSDYSGTYSFPPTAFRNERFLPTKSSMFEMLPYNTWP